MNRRQDMHGRSAPVSVRRATSAGLAKHGHRLANKDGAVLYLMALMMFVFLGITALAIDLGDWYVGRSEAQRAAEAGAHAGASIFLGDTTDEPGARAEAELFSEQNVVRGVTPDVFPVQDIDVILDSQKVRVRVQRSTARGNPVATIFARAMGINTVDIGAAAAAQVWPGVATDCVLPFAIPDLWQIPDGAGGYRYAEIGDTYDPTRPDYYKAATEGPGYTGYGIDKIGWSVQLTTSDPGESPQPGNYYSIRLPGSKGGADYKASILDCWEPPDEDYDFAIGDYVDKEPGNMIGPGQQAFSEIFSDPNELEISWVPGPGGVGGCPQRASNPGVCVGSESRRVRPVVMFDPQDWPDIDNGAKPVRITAFGGMFMDSFLPPNSVTVRFMQYVTISSAKDWDTAGGSLLRVLRIVE